MDKRAAARVMIDESAAGSIMLAAAVDILTLDGLHWDPKVIKDTLESAFDVKLPPRNFNRLMAAINVATSDAYWKSVPDFIALNNALASGSINLDVFDPATMEEISIGLAECHLIWPADSIEDEKEEFSVPVIDYINAVRRIEHFTIPPKIIQRMFGDKCPVWYEDLQIFSDDAVMYQAVYEAANEKAEAINEEVLYWLSNAIEHADRMQLDKTAKYISKFKSEVS